jgi:ribonucleoside-diphosphate reductase subunit M1
MSGVCLNKFVFYIKISLFIILYMKSLNIIKNNGSNEEFSLSKFESSINNLCFGLNIDCKSIIDSVLSGLHKDITTKELIEYTSETAFSMISKNYDYTYLASKIIISYLHKYTHDDYSQTISDLNENGILCPHAYASMMKHIDVINREIDYSRDYNFDFFGIKTLERSYLLRIDNKIVERPQDMYMRVAFGIHGDDVDSAIRTYHLMSTELFTHATPTLFNAGTKYPQMSSCFLVCMKEDSIEGIYDTLKECALISKTAGGIGLSIHNVRSKGSVIRSTNGRSNGIIPMIKVFNETAKYVDQGGGKRRGAFALYIEPWHADVFDFLDLRKNHGKEEHRARDIFIGLWMNDLFMKRVENDENWTLFDPGMVSGLSDVWGDEFDNLYKSYEEKGLGVRTIKAQQLWWAILTAQVETGTPYILYKDACNKKSNQQHLGTIKCSNLCTEIIQYTSPEETSVCNLASISLPKFVKSIHRDLRGKLYGMPKKDDIRNFDFDSLREIVHEITKNLNKIIDRNYYPVETARNSNMKHRPIGIGVQGLADAFILMGYSFESPEAMQLNRDIFECIYFSALEASNSLAKEFGPHESYNGSPASLGILQPDMWDVKVNDTRWDWSSLRKNINEFGLRNSLLVAPMPTASTSQIMGNNEAFEPYTSNIYVRRVLSGEFVVVNQHLISDLESMGLWNRNIINTLIANNGSVQSLPIPSYMKNVYKTAWEIKQKVLVDMAADRGAFIDQSQSFNVFLADPNFNKLTSFHFYAWKKGLKTGMYYLRTRPVVDPVKITIDKNSNEKEQVLVCTREAGCTMCGS